MTRRDFLDLLNKATATAVDFARQFVENDLPERVAFHVLLNQSFDGHATADERLYPEDDGCEYFRLSPEDVATLLLRDGHCPEWIDVSVEATSATDTHVRLLCCGRFTNNPRLMYYTDRGMGPFGIKSPDLPIGFKDGVKFRLSVQ